MKLIYLTNVRLPTEKAHGLQIMKMCEAFAEAKSAVSVDVPIIVELIVPRRLNPLKDDPFSYYGAKKNFKITRLPCIDLISLNMGQLGYWIEMTTFLLSAKIYLLFKKYDLLYTREFALGSFFKSYILEVHDLPKVATKYHISSWNNASKLVVLTRFLKEDLVAQGIEAGKIHISPDGVDLDEFKVGVSREEIRSKLNITQGQKKVVMYVGSFLLYGWKGVDTLLEAVKKLPGNISIVLVGGKPDELDSIRTTIGKSLDSKLGGNISLVGRVSHTDVPPYLKSADILVLPNNKGDANSERYTSPLKLFEYMASGVPIVASDLPSIREILNERNCTFFTPGDADSLAHVIQKVINDSEGTSLKAKKALVDVEGYAWTKRVQFILNFIS